MNFNKKLATAVSGAVLLMAGQIALADSTTDIVDALVSKGVLTEEEGKLISKGHTGEKKAQGKVEFKDGFKFSSGDGKSSIGLNGRIQADFRAFDVNKAATTTAPDTFDIRRSYLTAKGKFRNTSFEATFDGTGSTGAVALKYYWLEYGLSDAFNVRFGEFKTPMGLETQTSSRFNDMTERDWAAQLAPSINKGIMIHGVPTPGTTYQLMMSNGGLGYEAGQKAIETANGNDGKAFTGRLTLNAAEIMGNKDNIYHAGVSYGYDHHLPTSDKTDLTFATNGRGVTFFRANAGLSNPDITRYGLEGIVALGAVKLQAEYNNNTYEVRDIADKEIDAYYVNLSWMITGEKYANAYKKGLMDRMSPLNDYTGLGSSGWGAWELGLRYSDFDASDFTADTGYTNKAKSYTAGLKWITDPNTRFMLDYVYTDFNTPIYHISGSSAYAFDNEKALNFRAQFDF